jgi:Ala-tRNA(Pro) deacylase
MIPQKIISYLEEAAVPYSIRTHARAVTAQELAASVHVSGYRVAKAVLVEVDGTPWIAVLPATEIVDRQKLARALDAHVVRFLGEEEFGQLFPGCELGAEPPFGGLYGLPVVIDSSLGEHEAVVFRAGSHEEAIEMRYTDFLRLEHPLVSDIGAMVLPVERGFEEGRWI